MVKITSLYFLAKSSIYIIVIQSLLCFGHILGRKHIMDLQSEYKLNSIDDKRP